MKHRIHILLFLVFALNGKIGLAQNPTDSLEKKLQDKNLSDTTRLKILYKLSREYSFNAPDKALESIEQTIALAQKLKNQKAIGDVLSLKGKVLKNN